MSGLDPINTRFVSELIVELSQKGHTVLITTHQMPTVENLCSRMLMLHGGRPVLYGDLTEIRSKFASEVITLDTNARPEDVPEELVTSAESRGGQLRVVLRRGVTLSGLLRRLEDRNLTVTSLRNGGASLEDILSKGPAMLNRLFTIARFEFLSIIRRPAFILGVLLGPGIDAGWVRRGARIATSDQPFREESFVLYSIGNRRSGSPPVGCDSRVSRFSSLRFGQCRFGGSAVRQSWGRL